VVEAELAPLGLVLVLGVDPAQQIARHVRVRQGVERAPVRGRGDRRLAGALTAGQEGQRQLVELVAAGGKPGLDQREVQRRVIGDDRAVVDLDPGHVAGLRRIPALLLHPLTQGLDVEVVAEGAGGCLQAIAHPIASCPSSTSWNQ
jgi:hypothetical protein